MHVFTFWALLKIEIYTDNEVNTAKKILFELRKGREIARTLLVLLQKNAVDTYGNCTLLLNS